jgi:hypothetical protein
MYGFQNINEIKRLIGQNLIEICCNANQIVFEFDKDRITCEKGFKLTEKSGKNFDVGIPLNVLELLALIESKVETVVADGMKCIILKFSNGNMITFVDDDCYESYTFNIGLKNIVI